MKGIEDRDIIKKLVSSLLKDATIIGYKYTGIFSLDVNSSPLLIERGYPEVFHLDILTDWFMNSREEWSSKNKSFESIGKNDTAAFKSYEIHTLWNKEVIGASVTETLDLILQLGNNDKLIIPGKDEEWNELWDRSWELYSEGVQDKWIIISDSGLELIANVPSSASLL